MKNFILETIIFLILGISITYAQEALQDVVYLKNGSAIHGIILEQVPDGNIKIKTNDGNIFVFKMAEVQKILKEQKAVKDKVKRIRRKNPLISLGLSSFMPGAGQFYNGEIGEGIIYSTLTAGSVLIGHELLSGHGESAESMSFILLAIGGICYVWQIIDAPISSARINRKSQAQFGHLLEYRNGDKTLGMNFGFQDKVVTTQWTVHF